MLSDHSLITAVESDDVKGVRHLLDTQQNLLCAPGEQGDTALHCVAWNGLPDVRDSRSSQIFQMLLSAAVNLKKNEILLNTPNIRGETPLTRALRKSKIVHDVFTQRAAIMIRHGARLPETPYAKNLFEKLPIAIQQFIQEQITIATQPPKQPPTPPKTNQSHQDTLIKYNSEGQGSSGLRHRAAASTDKKEFEMKPL